MLTRRAARPVTGAVAAVLTLALTGALSGTAAADPAGPAGPAAAGPADPGPPASSVIGDGNLVGDRDYLGSANPDPDVQATAGTARDDACTPLAGAVAAEDAADYQRRLRGESPRGEGAWRYVLCAETAERSRALALRHPAAAAAETHCATSANRCAVVVVWEPKDKRPQRREQAPPRRLGAFDRWLDFTPELTTSPTDQIGLIAELPTWVWDRNTAGVRGICLPVYGGVCGFAVRLSTSWKTDGRRFCGSPGRQYRPGRDDPKSASGCSYTYRTAGTYGITGCKNWLVVVWRLPWYIPIVFPLELCDTDQVGVQESQVLAGGRPS